MRRRSLAAGMRHNLVGRGYGPGQHSIEAFARSGYGGRGNRFPRLRFKTVLETFTSHGSSVICFLSRTPLRACSLFFHASPRRVIHTSRLLVCSRLIQRYWFRPLAYHRPHVCLSWTLLQAFASWGIPPPCRNGLTPAQEEKPFSLESDTGLLRS